MSMFWTEDYIFSIPEPPQILSWMMAVGRCGVKYLDLPIHMYIMPHGPGQLPEYLISAQSPTTLDKLRRAIFEALDVVRVYTKKPIEKTPDYSHPYTIRRGQTLVEDAEQVHKDFAQNLKYARIWSEPTHTGTNVKPDYVPKDRDVVEFHV